MFGVGQQAACHQSTHARIEDLHHVGDPDADDAPDQKSCPHVRGQEPFLFGKAYGKQLACCCENGKFGKAHQVGVCTGKCFEHLARGGNDQNGGKACKGKYDVDNDQNLFPCGGGSFCHVMPPCNDILRQRRAGWLQGTWRARMRVPIRPRFRKECRYFWPSRPSAPR